MEQLTHKELRTLREDIEVMRVMHRVRGDAFCQMLLTLIDGLEVELARPYDAGWHYTVTELGAALGEDPSCHPSNVICMAINRIGETPPLAIVKLPPREHEPGCVGNSSNLEGDPAAVTAAQDKLMEPKS